jgi:hypothetical protein
MDDTSPAPPVLIEANSYARAKHMGRRTLGRDLASGRVRSVPLDKGRMIPLRDLEAALGGELPEDLKGRAYLCVRFVTDEELPQLAAARALVATAPDAQPATQSTPPTESKPKRPSVRFIDPQK